MRIRFLAAALAAAALAGCSGGAGPSGQAGSDPAGVTTAPTTTAAREGSCALVSDQEFAAIVGRSITDTKPGVAFSGPGCDWYDDQGGTVEMSLLTGQEYEDAKLGSTPLRTVAGVGDEAYLGSYGRVFVSDGDRHLVVGTTAKVADGQVSPNIRDAAGPGQTTESLLAWEVSFRIVRLILDRV
jgi:hypothetical protein